MGHQYGSEISKDEYGHCEEREREPGDGIGKELVIQKITATWQMQKTKETQAVLFR